MKNQLLILFAFISVLALSQVPQRFNKVIVTGDITSPKFIKTGSNADSVLLGNGSARAISTIKTDTVSLSNRINAKATGNGTANGINTGDETLSSIKTKLGAATSVSDGYLKYQDWSIFNSKEPAITKNSGFNLPLGNTPGTVLEGRTFGTAANSAVGDFIQNQNSSAQTANSWISGSGTFGSYISSSKYKAFLAAQTALRTYSKEAIVEISSYQSVNEAPYTKTTDIVANADAGANSQIRLLTTTASGTPTTALLLSDIGAATFSSTVNSTGFLLNGNNLTSSLATNYIPKWNGSAFVNATAGTDYQRPITLTTNGTSGAATFSGNVLNVPNYTQSTPYSYGAYSPTVTAIAGISSIGTNTSYFTNIGSIYHVSSLVGLITSVNVNETCTVQITLPSTPTTSTSISVMGVAGDAVQAYYNGSASGNTIRITFKSPVASGAGTTVKITADYY